MTTNLAITKNASLTQEKLNLFDLEKLSYNLIMEEDLDPRIDENECGKDYVIKTILIMVMLQ